MRRRKLIRHVRREVDVLRNWPPPARGRDGLGIRWLAARDREAYLASIDDEVRYWQGYDDRQVAAMGAVFDLLDRRSDLYLPRRQIVVEHEGRLAGAYGLTPGVSAEADIRVGWWLVPHARGKGLGQASLRLVLDYVHEDLGLRVACMGTADGNHRAIRQIEAVGAVFHSATELHLPDGRVVGGRWYHH